MARAVIPLRKQASPAPPGAQIRLQEFPMWITDFRLFWLVIGIIVAIKSLALVFRILNRLVDRLLPPAATARTAEPPA
jgi:hypothetical protein